MNSISMNDTTPATTTPVTPVTEPEVVATPTAVPAAEETKTA